MDLTPKQQKRTLLSMGITMVVMGSYVALARPFSNLIPLEVSMQRQAIYYFVGGLFVLFGSLIVAFALGWWQKPAWLRQTLNCDLPHGLNLRIVDRNKGFRMTIKWTWIVALAIVIVNLGSLILNKNSERPMSISILITGVLLLFWISIIFRCILTSGANRDKDSMS